MKIIGELPRVPAAQAADAIARGEPVVIERAIEDWPARRTWSREALAERFGDVAVKWKVSANAAHPNFHAATMKEMFATQPGTLRELFAQLAGGHAIFTGDEKFVLRRRDGVTTLDPDLAPLLDDVRVPAWIPPDRLYTVWSWFSGAGARTWLHYDNNGAHNLNAQILGEKTCVLIDPAHVAGCALWPLAGPNPAKNCSQIDVAQPAHARFPEFAEVPAFTARLHAGDVLFLPAWWLHAFEHLGAFNANLNFWWLPEGPVDNAVARYQAEIGMLSSRGGRPG